ncbi:hypothetical protein TA3x_005806 (plasmid) [Tundrisphaera sp. TA3]|uniref:hypothetical protein n=1 Tax=Tundrisphaera sp. TA3 TaxID=3435775 RepID=UPI003EC0510C
MIAATTVFESLPADNPFVLLLAAGSLALILAVLYQGGWRHVANAVVRILLCAYGLALVGAGFIAFGLFWLALFGEERNRAGNFIGAVIVTASMLVINPILTRDNLLTRFLSSLFINEEDNSN